MDYQKNLEDILAAARSCDGDNELRKDFVDEVKDRLDTIKGASIASDKESLMKKGLEALLNHSFLQTPEAAPVLSLVTATQSEMAAFAQRFSAPSPGAQASDGRTSREVTIDLLGSLGSFFKRPAAATPAAAATPSITKPASELSAQPSAAKLDRVESTVSEASATPAASAVSSVADDLGEDADQAFGDAASIQAASPFFMRNNGPRISSIKSEECLADTIENSNRSILSALNGETLEGSKASFEAISQALSRHLSSDKIQPDSFDDETKEAIVADLKKLGMNAESIKRQLEKESELSESLKAIKQIVENIIESAGKLAERILPQKIRNAMRV